MVLIYKILLVSSASYAGLIQVLAAMIDKWIELGCCWAEELERMSTLTLRPCTSHLGGLRPLRLCFISSNDEALPLRVVPSTPIVFCKSDIQGTSTILLLYYECMI